MRWPCDLLKFGLSETSTNPRHHARPIVAGFLDRVRRTAFGLLAAIAISATAIAPATAQFALRAVPPENQFFRFKAEYLVKATGEVVRFDLVRPCLTQYAKDVFGDSVGLGLLGTGKYEPGSYFGPVNRFPKVTQDGHAIVVQIPRACEGETTANGKVPPDLLPFVSWFEDANDLTQGLMYATEDAYHSPLAKIEFRGASIEAASSEDFKDWLDHAADGFRPSRDIQSPHGLTQHDIFGGGSTAQFCNGYAQLALPQELIPRVQDLRLPAAQTAIRFQYFGLFGGADKLTAFFESINALGAKYRYGGLPVTNFHQFYLNPRVIESSPTWAHGAFGDPDMRPVPLFPLSHIPHGMRSAPTEKANGAPLFDVDLRPEMRGFLSCLKASGDMAHLYPDLDGQKIEWRANGKEIAGQFKQRPIAPRPPEHFFEDAIFMYSPAQVM